MNELAIKKHNFEEAKNRLKEFSMIENSELTIANVETAGGLFGWFDHKVTGEELNNRMAVIQDFFIKLNTADNKTIKEFREIYNALDILDKEYITSIIATVKGLEKTSNDVRKQQEQLSQHHDQLQEQHDKLDSHQEEIDKIIENDKKTIEILKKFKQKLDGYKHLADVDAIYNQTEHTNSEIQNQAQKIEYLTKRFDTHIEAEETSKEIEHEIDNITEQLPSDFKTTFSKLFRKYTIKTKNDFHNLDANIKKIERKINGIKPASKFPIVAGIIAIILGAGAFISIFLPLKVYIDNKENEYSTTLSEMFQNDLKSFESVFETKLNSIHAVVEQKEETISALDNDIDKLQEEYKTVVNNIDEKMTSFTESFTSINNEINAKEEKIISVQKAFEDFKNEYQNVITLNEEKIANLEKEIQEIIAKQNNDLGSNSEKKDEEDLDNYVDVKENTPTVSLTAEKASSQPMQIENNEEILQKTDDTDSIAKNDNMEIISATENNEIFLDIQKESRHTIKRIFLIVGIVILAVLFIGGIILFIVKKF